MINHGQSAAFRDLYTLLKGGCSAGYSDGQLLERFTTRGPDEAEHAFTTIVVRHGPMVLRVCRRVLADPHDVEDAFQATFLVLVKKASSVRKYESLGSWLYGVAFRVASCARAAAIRRRLHERKGAAVGDFDRPEFGDDLNAVMHEELAKLPEKFRDPVVLCYLQGRTYDEAAAQLKWPVGTVKSRLARARERLQSRLSARGFAPATIAVASALASEANAASLPGSLVESTVHAATQFVIKPAEVTGAISATVVTLTEGALRTMAMTQWKTLAYVGLSIVGIVASGVVARAQRLPVNRDAASAASKPSSEPSAYSGETSTVTEAPPPLVVSAAPARDRLKDVEDKLDRLLNAIEGSALAPRHRGAPLGANAPADVLPVTPGHLVPPPVANAPVGRMPVAVPRPSSPTELPVATMPSPADIAPRPQPRVAIEPNSLEPRVRSLESRIERLEARLRRLETVDGPVQPNAASLRGPDSPPTTDVAPLDAVPARNTEAKASDVIRTDPVSLPAPTRSDSSSEPLTIRGNG